MSFQNARGRRRKPASRFWPPPTPHRTTSGFWHACQYLSVVGAHAREPRRIAPSLCGGQTCVDMADFAVPTSRFCASSFVWNTTFPVRCLLLAVADDGSVRGRSVAVRFGLSETMKRSSAGLLENMGKPQVVVAMTRTVVGLRQGRRPGGAISWLRYRSCRISTGSSLRSPPPKRQGGVAKNGRIQTGSRGERGLVKT